jgi:ABC-type sugar transport system substrate-binding protein
VKARPIAIAAVSAVLLAVGAGGAEHAASLSGRAELSAVRAGGANRTPIRIGLVLKALDNPFFVAIYAGASNEATHLNVRLTVRSVTNSNDLTGEAAQLRALVAQGADCYVVNPSTATNLVGALRGVRRPIVNVDSPIDPGAAKRAGVRIQTYIGTDDFAAGRMAGSRMASLLGGIGDVALIGGQAGSVNSVLRLRGFEAGIRGSRLSVVARANADYDRTKAQIATEQILQTHPRISGFFAANDLMALGIADAVSAAGKAGQVKVIGVDGSSAALDAIRSGSIAASISQYPYIMGRMAVEACAAAARGATLPVRVDAPIASLARNNVASAIASFPNPLQRYSDPFTPLLRTGGRVNSASP